MNSELTVISEVGKGSKFTFELPMCRITNFENIIPVNNNKDRPRKKSVFIDAKSSSLSNLL